MLLMLGCFCGKRQRLAELFTALVAAATLSLGSPPAFGATILKIHSDHDKLLLGLTTAELNQVEEGQQTLVEVATPKFIAGGVFAKFNAVKKTVVVELPDADERFAVKQQVRFLPLLLNVASSPIITSAAQYPNGTHPMVEGGVGGFFEGSQETASGNKGSHVSKGARLLAHGYLVLNSEAYGLNLDFEHRASGSQLRPIGGSSSLDVHYDQLAPSVWVEVWPHWRLGLRYDYTVIVQAYSGDSQGSYQFSLARPIGALLWTDVDTEIGLDVSTEHNAGASAEYVKTSGQKPTTTYEKRLYKAPAEVLLHYRHVTSPFFAWGAGAGYIFFSRTQGDGKALEPRAQIPQLLRFRLNFEQRIADGDKFEWVLSYDGGKARGLSTLELTANEVGLQATYQSQLANKWICGVTFDVAGGFALLADNKLDASGKSIEVDRKVIGYRSGFIAFANYAFDPLLKKGRK